MKRRVEALLVEDSRTMARLVLHHLSQIETLDVRATHVETLSEVFLYLGSQPVDIILLDLSLGDSTAVNTVAQMHQLSGDRAIVVLSENDRPELRDGCFQAGATDFVRKRELSPVVLERAVVNALNTRALARYLEVTQALTEAFERSATLGVPGPLPASREARDELDAAYARLLSAFLAQAMQSPLALPEVVRLMRSHGLSSRDVRAIHARVVRQALVAADSELSRQILLTSNLLLLSLVLGELADQARYRKT